MGLKDWFEVRFWHLAIWLIRRGYGADCTDYELECSGCQAKKTIEWIENHIELIKL